MGLVDIGFERQLRQRLAEMRTNTLVSVGSALFVMMGMMTPGDSSPTRIAAQVASAIGFLVGTAGGAAPAAVQDRTAAAALKNRGAAVKGRPSKGKDHPGMAPEAA
ncbi:MAG: MgtC/SapB family protein [Desulfobaccales bacterium]